MKVIKVYYLFQWHRSLKTSKIEIAKKTKFSIKDFFSKCDQTRSTDLVTFTEEILNGKLHFLCSERALQQQFTSFYY